MPEAGASTVALTVGRRTGRRTADLDAVRDAWIAELNQLDWTGLDHGRRLPAAALNKRSRMA